MSEEVTVRLRLGARHVDVAGELVAGVVHVEVSAETIAQLARGTVVHGGAALIDFGIDKIAEAIQQRSRERRRG